MNRVAFTVLGDPQPQGSKTTIQQRGRRPRVIEDNPLTHPWRQAVAAAALEAMDGRQVRDGPQRLRATFVLRRPAGHYGTGRNEGKLKPSAPLYCRTRPDVDKLVRAIGDAITGIVCRDDARLVVVHAEKHYGETACAHIVVEELDLDDDRAVPAETIGPTPNPEGGPVSETQTEDPTTEPEPAPEPDDDGDNDDDGNGEPDDDE